MSGLQCGTEHFYTEIFLLSFFYKSTYSLYYKRISFVPKVFSRDTTNSSGISYSMNRMPRERGKGFDSLQLSKFILQFNHT